MGDLLNRNETELKECGFRRLPRAFIGGGKLNLITAHGCSEVGDGGDGGDGGSGGDGGDGGDSGDDDTEPLTTLQCFLIFSILAMVMSQFPNMNSLFGLSLVGSVMAVAYSTAVWTLLLASERNQNSVS
ncbi:hypothetical protein YC2023_043181 [Brassica napus]